METQDDEVIFKAKNPRKLAYYLRQAFRFINKYDTDYRKIDFSFKETPSSVICIRKVSDSISFTDLITENGELVANIRSAEDVVGYCIANDGFKKLYFADYSPKATELLILEKWGATCKIEFTLRNNKLIAQRKHDSATGN